VSESVDRENIQNRLRVSLFQIRNKCLSRDRGFNSTYQHGLDWKLQIFSYHTDEVRSVREKLLTPKTQVEWLEAFFLQDAHLIAAMQALHSMTDILAQVLNVALAHKPLKEEQVCFRKIPDLFYENNSLVEKAVALQDMYEYLYVEGFTNITKHRRLLSTRHLDKFSYIPQEESDIYIVEFDYKKTHFDSTTVDEVLDNFAKKILDSICEILEITDSRIT